MKKAFRILILCTALLSGAVWTDAKQSSLPAIPLPSEIKHGSFPNGLSYYVISNKAQVGYSDFALIQDGVSEMCIPQQPLLISKGVGYGQDGYTSEVNGSSIIRFRNVPVSNPAIMDSTLLMMLDFIRKSGKRQTVIVCGDVDQARTIRTLEVMSLTVPYLKPVSRKVPEGTKSFELVSENSGKLHRIGINYRLSLPKVERRNSAVTFVTELLSRQFCVVLSERVSQQFRMNGLPFEGLHTEYRACQGDMGDNCAEFSFHVLGKDAARADSLFGSIIDDIREYGVSKKEFSETRKLTIPSVVISGLKPGAPNEKYVDRCIDATLFGLSVNGSETIRNFFKGRQLPEEKDLELFNNFARAIISDGPIAPIKERRETYVPDSLKTFLTPVRLRVKSEAAESTSGGKIFTFENGIRVIYRKMNDHPGRFGYAFMLRGGMTLIPDISIGEAPFVADMMDLCTISGSYSGPDFRRLLAQNGITLQKDVTMSDLRIYGSAPSGGLAGLLSAINSLAYHRSADYGGFGYFRKCQEVRTILESNHNLVLDEVTDSIVCPDNIYMKKRNAYAIGDNLLANCENYLDERFSNFADGVIVIVGDIEEDEVRTVMERSLASFRTSRQHALRKPVSFNVRTGRTLSTGRAKPSSANVYMAASRAVTIQSYAAIRVASKYLNYSLNRMMTSDGAFISVNDRFEIYPNEKMSLSIRCVPCPEESLPLGIEPSDPFDCARHLRAAIDRLSTSRLSAADLALCKKLVKGEADVDGAKSEKIIEKVLMRYADGKDFTTGFDKVLDSLTAKDVEEMISTLCRSARVEYVFY